jgi:hypothetical protein
MAALYAFAAISISESKNMSLCKVIFISLLFLSVNAFADVNLDGVWKHTQKPAWLEIEFKSGVGSVSVKRHDNNPKSAGLNVIKEIKLDLNQTSLWVGQMYSGAKNDYVDVTLILINPTTLAVYESGDLNKSNEILRLIRE